MGMSPARFTWEYFLFPPNPVKLRLFQTKTGCELDPFNLLISQTWLDFSHVMWAKPALTYSCQCSGPWNQRAHLLWLTADLALATCLRPSLSPSSRFVPGSHLEKRKPSWGLLLILQSHGSRKVNLYSCTDHIMVILSSNAQTQSVLWNLSSSFVRVREKK